MIHYGAGMGIVIVVSLILAAVLIGIGRMTEDIAMIIFLGTIAALITVFLLAEAGLIRNDGGDYN